MLLKFLGKRHPHNPEEPTYEDGIGLWPVGRIHNLLDHDPRVPFWVTTKCYAEATAAEWEAQIKRDAGIDEPPVVTPSPADAGVNPQHSETPATDDEPVHGEGETAS